MNRKRLRILANFLKRVDRKHFDLREWAIIDGGKIEDGHITQVGCGTTACAMGWATSIPSFRRDGLILKKGRYGFYPSYMGNYSEPSICSFFGISIDEMDVLFMSHEYPPSRHKDPLAVAERIEALLAQPNRSLT